MLQWQRGQLQKLHLHMIVGVVEVAMVVVGIDATEMVEVLGQIDIIIVEIVHVLIDNTSAWEILCILEIVVREFSCVLRWLDCSLTGD